MFRSQKPIVCQASRRFHGAAGAAPLPWNKSFRDVSSPWPCPGGQSYTIIVESEYTFLQFFLLNICSICSYLAMLEYAGICWRMYWILAAEPDKDLDTAPSSASQRPHCGCRASLSMCCWQRGNDMGRDRFRDAQSSTTLSFIAKAELVSMSAS